VRGPLGDDRFCVRKATLERKRPGKKIVRSAPGAVGTWGAQGAALACPLNIVQGLRVGRDRHGRGAGGGGRGLG